MKRKNKADSERLLELLGAAGESAPESMMDARDRLDADGGTVHLNTAVRGPCGKVSYGSESKARSAISSRLKKGANTGRLRAYQCPHCPGAWHMTSTIGR